MNIEIVAIGNEVLAGMVVNSNAAFISQQLKKNSWQTARHVVLPDGEGLMSGLKEALDRSDVVITTGGLGPTCDDLTRSVAAALFNSDFHYDKKVAEDLTKRYGEELISLHNQATVPSKAEVLLNRVGTAPGLILRTSSKTLILLPGIPEEMRVMFSEQVIPYLAKHFPPKEKIYSERLYLCLHSESAVDPYLCEIIEELPDVEVGIYPSIGTLTIYLGSKNRDNLARAKEKIERQFSSFLFTPPSEKIEAAVHQAFTLKKKTLALAESCTGGAIAARLTTVPGASDYFLGSLVVYSNGLKTKLLDVSEKTLTACGAVSQETVKEMLDGVFAITTADYAVAVTGIAGPAREGDKKPVGTIWAAIGERGQPCETHLLQARGDRQKIIQWTTERLLSLLWRKLMFTSFSKN